MMMQPTQGNKLLFRFFEGTLKEITLAVDRWCLEDGANFDVVGVEYNYQAPELDGRRQVQEAHHGVLLTLRMLTVNERREREGLTPFRSGAAEDQGVPEPMPDGRRGQGYGQGPVPWYTGAVQAKPGEIVEYQGATDAQVRWGGADDPRLKMAVGRRYVVEAVEVHSWHTEIKLHRVEGWFNSVCFSDPRIAVDPETLTAALAQPPEEAQDAN